MKRLSKNDDIFKEDKFYPDIKETEFKKISYPVNFSLVPEILFDSLYKQINKSNKHQKSDYSYNVILGENAFIIQNKNVYLNFKYKNAEKPIKPINKTITVQSKPFKEEIAAEFFCDCLKA